MTPESKDGVLDIILRTAQMEPDDSIAIDYAGMGLETHPAARAVHVLREKLLDEYAKQGDPRGALGPAWFWVDNEWKCDVHEMYVATRNDIEGNLVWCFGYMACEEIADVGGPREGMRAAEEWSRTHPEEDPAQPPRTTTFSAEELVVLRKMCLGGIGLTPEETQPICEKLGIG